MKFQSERKLTSLLWPLHVRRSLDNVLTPPTALRRAASFLSTLTTMLRRFGSFRFDMSMLFDDRLGRKPLELTACILSISSLVDQFFGRSIFRSINFLIDQFFGRSITFLVDQFEILNCFVATTSGYDTLTSEVIFFSAIL
jgi:hypothetical protein